MNKANINYELIRCIGKALLFFIGVALLGSCGSKATPPPRKIETADAATIGAANDSLKPSGQTPAPSTAPDITNKQKTDEKKDAKISEVAKAPCDCNIEGPSNVVQNYIRIKCSDDTYLVAKQAEVEYENNKICKDPKWVKASFFENISIPPSQPPSASLPQ